MESLALEHLPLDDQVEALVDGTPTVVGFDPDDATQTALINDLATKLSSNTVVARRFGLTLPQLYEFVRQDEVRRRIKTRRAIWESDGNIGERNRAYYGAVTLEAAPIMDRLLHNPTTPPGHLLKAFEVAGRLGGVDSKPSSQVLEGSQAGSQFSVQIVFSGGKVEKITMPNDPPPLTIDGDSLP
jgi:hypothetical protein